MKTYLVITALSILTMLSASAQDDTNVRRDVTYSTHNYKHPNKAAAARQWASQEGVTVTAPALKQGPAVSYKHQAPGAKPAGGVVVPHTPETDVAVRNYKIQRIREPRSAASAAEMTAGTPLKQTSTSGD